MYYVYVLFSVNNKVLYIGYTNNIKRRLVEHNTNKSFSTKNQGRWVLVYCEMYRSKEDAVKREHRLKYYGQALYRLKERIGGSLSLAKLVRG